MTPRPDTWMPIYWGDYARDTGHLNSAGHGAYLMLIKHYWCTGEPLTDDDDELWRVACCDSKRDWLKLRPKVSKLFRISDGKWRHKRIDTEMERAAKKTQAKAEAGRLGAEKRWGKDGAAIADPSRCHKQTDAASQPHPANAGAAREKWMGRSAELEREGSEATGMDAERFLHQNGVVTMLDLEDEGFDILKHQLPLYRRIRDRKRKAGEPPPSRMTYFVKALRSEYADKPPPPVHEPEMVWVLETDARWEWLAARYRREKNRDVVAYSSAREEGVGAHFDKAWLAEAA